MDQWHINVRLHTTYQHFPISWLITCWPFGFVTICVPSSEADQKVWSLWHVCTEKQATELQKSCISPALDRCHQDELVTLQEAVGEFWFIESSGQFFHHYIKDAPDKHFVISSAWKAVSPQNMMCIWWCSVLNCLDENLGQVKYINGTSYYQTTHPICTVCKPWRM